MKIYTKRGDSGETDLFGGERVFKNHIRVKTYGAIDAANCAIGQALSAHDLSESLKGRLIEVMKLLFSAGAEIATASHERAQHLLERHLKNRILEHHIVSLESAIDEIQTHLSPLKNFILPCGTEASARLHLARSMVREAEIALIDLQHSDQSAMRPEIVKFFNRLSDYLFVMARLANKEASVPDITWDGSLD